MAAVWWMTIAVITVTLTAVTCESAQVKKKNFLPDPGFGDPAHSLKHKGMYDWSSHFNKKSFGKDFGGLGAGYFRSPHMQDWNNFFAEHGDYRKRQFGRFDSDLDLGNSIDSLGHEGLQKWPSFERSYRSFNRFDDHDLGLGQGLRYNNLQRWDILRKRFQRAAKEKSKRS